MYVRSGCCASLYFRRSSCLSAKDVMSWLGLELYTIFAKARHIWLVFFYQDVEVLFFRHSKHVTKNQTLWPVARSWHPILWTVFQSRWIFSSLVWHILILIFLCCISGIGFTGTLLHHTSWKLYFESQNGLYKIVRCDIRL